MDLSQRRVLSVLRKRETKAVGSAPFSLSWRDVVMGKKEVAK